jgi:hypothetical protein
MFAIGGGRSWVYGEDSWLERLRVEEVEEVVQAEVEAAGM